MMTTTATKRRLNGRRLWSPSARFRIAAWYLLLVGASLAAILVAVRQVLLYQVEQRTADALRQEAEEFSRLPDEVNPVTGQPLGLDVAALFDAFLARNVTGPDEVILTLIDGEPYKITADPIVRVDQDAIAVARWAAHRTTAEGSITSDAGPGEYIAVPLVDGDAVVGTFIVVVFPARERQVVNDAIRTLALIAGGVLAVASLLAWGVSGRVLRPVRDLGRTARSITESDLSRRIPISGNDDIATVAATFNQMLDRLEVAFATQRRFLDDAGHELRTPITIIRGHLELAGEDPIERAETSQLLIDELDRMARMVDDLILLAKSEHPDFLRPQPLALHAFTRGLVDRARSIDNRDWRCELGDDATLFADGQRLTQAVMNLVVNAARYSTPGSPVTIGSRVRSGAVEVWVADLGPGIAAADKERIFDRFVRGSDGRTMAEGSGLGLAIARAVAVAHGGCIELKTTPGAGSTFTITLPWRGTGGSG